MTDSNNNKTFWPSEEQLLLLRSCLLKDNEAVKAFEEWIARADIDHLDQGSFRLLPLLYKNLRALGVKHSLMNKFGGIYRMEWYKNRILLYNTSKLINSLNEAGIQTMLLKGAALTLQYYKDFGLRPMWDIDILVKPDKIMIASNHLIKLGWQSHVNDLEEHISYIHAVNFEHSDGRNIDLHWHVLCECCDANADKDFWENAVETVLYEVTTFSLNATDQLFHVCVHGSRWMSISSLRWVSDSMVILNNQENSIDWDRLIKLAQKHHLLIILKETLTYLNENIAAIIPQHVIERLEELKPSMFEFIDYHYRSNHTDILLGTYPRRLLHYLRLMNGLNLFRKITECPNYLKYAWNLKYNWQIPLFILHKATRRIKAQFR